MVLCPIALAVGCRNCPVFKVCPVKSTIGDYKPPAGGEPATHASAKAKPAAKKTAAKNASSQRRSSKRR